MQSSEIIKSTKKTLSPHRQTVYNLLSKHGPLTVPELSDLIKNETELKITNAHISSILSTLITRRLVRKTNQFPKGKSGGCMYSFGVIERVVLLTDPCPQDE